MICCSSSRVVYEDVIVQFCHLSEVVSTAYFSAPYALGGNEREDTHFAQQAMRHKLPLVGHPQDIPLGSLGGGFFLVIFLLGLNT